MDLTCSFAKEANVTLHDFFVPLFRTISVEINSGSDPIEVSMSLFTDPHLTTPLGQGQEGDL